MKEWSPEFRQTLENQVENPPPAPTGSMPEGNAPDNRNQRVAFLEQKRARESYLRSWDMFIRGGTESCHGPFENNIKPFLTERENSDETDSTSSSDSSDGEHR